jgi:hypothetical protein
MRRGDTRRGSDLPAKQRGLAEILAHVYDSLTGIMNATERVGRTELECCGRFCLQGKRVPATGRTLVHLVYEGHGGMCGPCDTEKDAVVHVVKVGGSQETCSVLEDKGKGGSVGHWGGESLSLV